MSRTTTYASLISYLQPSPAYLRISLRSHDPEELERLSNPFLTVDDSSPIGTLIQGRFVTDGNTTLQDLFLFVEKTSYGLNPDSLDPITNRDISSLWQGASGLYASRPDSGLVELSALFNHDRSLNTFAPLFFCKLKKAYFEPVCPNCGRPLVQCEDDELLTSKGLPPFSSTLHRYLYCEDCEQAGKGQFYVYERGEENPEIVRDRLDLIARFSSLLDNPDINTALPCLGCDQNEICFGPQQKATSRIAFFSFYPFHVLPFRSAGVHCTDFLALLSGAKGEQISSTVPAGLIRKARIMDVQAHLGKGLAFFFDPPRRFLEVLYLKLVFLRQLAQWVSEMPFKELSPLTSLSFDSFWVDVPEPSDALPYFWNFKLNPRGLIIFYGHRAFPHREFPTSRVDLLGLAWFFVLLRNGQQGMQEILAQINELFSNGSPVSTEEFISRLEASSIPAFEPEQIFWDPQGVDVPDQFRALWRSCMELGWKLVQASFDREPQAPEADIWIEKIEELESRVKSSLFAFEAPEVTASVPVEEKKDTNLDAQIAIALSRIAARWEAEMLETVPPTPEPPLPAQEPEPEEAMAPMEETIIVAPKTAATSPAEQPDLGPQQAAGPEPSPEEEEIPETIIFSAPVPGSSPSSSGEEAPTAQPKAPREPPKPSQDKEFEKTLSMLDQELLGLVDEAPEAREEEPEPEEGAHQEEKGEEEIPETVVIKPEDR